jgi:hypothetical protein
MSAKSEMIGTGALRGFWPAPTTSTISRPAWNEGNPVERHAHLDDLDRLFARHVLAIKMLTLPCTKLSITNFLPVSCS